MKAALTALILGATALPAMAFDPAQMNDAEKAAFGQAVRDYLMENPQVLIEAITVMEERNASAQVENDKVMIANNSEAIFNDGHSWVGGNPEGDVTLVEFIDYRCGYCKQINPHLEELVATDGNIRFILKEFPILTDESILAARFAIAVQQIGGADSYKKAHDQLMASRGPVTLDILGRLAGELGLDSAAVLNRMNTEDVTAVLRKNGQLAEQLHIQATPTFIINGEMVRGASPDGLERAIATAREKG